MDARGNRGGGDVLVLAYALASQLEVQAWQPDAPLPARAALLAGVLALLARRRAPRAAALACAAGGAVAEALLPADSGTGVGIVTAAVAAWLLGAQGRSGVAGVLAVVATTVAGHVLEPVQASDVVTAPAVLCAAAVAAAGLSRARRRAAVLRDALEQAEQEGRVAEATLLTAERRRVARELHDVASHHLTVAALQASAARVQLDGDRTVARDALCAAEQAGREALADLRPLLGLLGGDAHADLAPQPSLAELPRLLAQVRGAGLDVRLSVDGPLPELAGGPDLVAYRVVQEALTNALRHGTGIADLHLSCADAAAPALVITVENPLPRRPRPTAGGHGLVGLHERVTLYGGTLHARRTEGRFVVHAVLPAHTAVTVPAGRVGA